LLPLLLPDVDVDGLELADDVFADPVDVGVMDKLAGRAVMEDVSDAVTLMVLVSESEVAEEADADVSLPELVVTASKTI
jgi:hypothetical protein